jgi:hypothetical protein
MMETGANRRCPAPAVDERLVAPESGYEIIDGNVVAVPGCDEPRGRRHSKVNAVLEAHVKDAYDVASDMLTRTTETTDFAPDASVYPVARDAATGGRQLECLAFEVVSTQTLGDAGKKAAKLCARGVRRVFAVDVQRERACEWSRDTGAWAMLPDDGGVEDPCFVVPLPVEALVKAAKTDDAVATALLAKGNAVLVEAIEAGRAEGEVHAARRILLRAAQARGWSLSRARREQGEACSDAERLELWAARSITASRVDDIFD